MTTLDDAARLTDWAARRLDLALAATEPLDEPSDEPGPVPAEIIQDDLTRSTGAGHD